jgi:hypothetical protein
MDTVAVVALVALLVVLRLAVGALDLRALVAMPLVQLLVQRAPMAGQVVLPTETTVALRSALVGLGRVLVPVRVRRLVRGVCHFSAGAVEVVEEERLELQLIPRVLSARLFGRLN